MGQIPAAPTKPLNFLMICQVMYMQLIGMGFLPETTLLQLYLEEWASPLL